VRKQKIMKVLGYLASKIKDKSFYNEV